MNYIYIYYITIFILIYTLYMLKPSQTIDFYMFGVTWSLKVDQSLPRLPPVSNNLHALRGSGSRNSKLYVPVDHRLIPDVNMLRGCQRISVTICQREYQNE